MYPLCTALWVHMTSFPTHSIEQVHPELAHEKVLAQEAKDDGRLGQDERDGSCERCIVG